MIRKLNKTDIDMVAQIWLEVNIQTHHFIPEKYWEEQFNAVKQMLPQSEVYVYEESDKVLGFMGLTDNSIEGIFVSMNSQSGGIGKQLLDFVKGIKTGLSLHVYQKNKRAIRFYQREKFIIQSESIDENTGEREFLMSWER